MSRSLRRWMSHPDGDAGYCWYAMCGGAVGNGRVFRDCRIGERARDGTCFPAGGGGPDTVIGICFEAGTGEPGDLCDSNASPRNAGERALVCDSGSYCLGDLDPVGLPEGDLGGRGRCARFCDPPRGHEFACDNDQTCLDLSSPDDPATPDVDETRPLGFCVPDECDVVTNDCGAGLVCRPTALYTRRGFCTAPGNSRLGEQCGDSTDCRDAAFCVNLGLGNVCVAPCEPSGDDGACRAGGSCREFEYFAFGLCL